MSNRLRLALGGALIVAASSQAFSAEPAMRILQHEAVQLTTRSAAQGKRRITFDAFGRRFDLRLEPNERLSRSLPHGLREVEPLRGDIEGLPGSWVRLTRSAAGWQGMIFDGSEAYAIEPAADVETLAVQPLAQSGTAPVIYRLADMLLPLGAGSCGTVANAESSTALQAYEALTSELQAGTAGLSPTRQISIAVVGDFEFASYFAALPTTAMQAIIARMNIVDGIFSSQLGIKVEVPTISIFEDARDPFTKTEARALLDELRAFRASSPAHLVRGLTHLMTGRSLNGETVGIAYLGSACGGEFAASLSQGTRSTTGAALIAAHEIGHNFNAPHDGEGACAAESTNFLMAPRINGSDQFSSCSLQQMQALAARLSCLASYSPPDITLDPAPANIQAAPNEIFVLPFVVRAAGGAASTSVTGVVALPAGLTVSAASAINGPCTVGAGAVSCTLGTMQAGMADRIDLHLTGGATGTFPVSLAVFSDNDSVPTNNAVQASVTISEQYAAVAEQGGASSGEGGGGIIAPDELAALAALWILRRFGRRRTHTQRRVERSSVSTRT